MGGRKEGERGEVKGKGGERGREEERRDIMGVGGREGERGGGSGGKGERRKGAGMTTEKLQVSDSGRSQLLLVTRHLPQSRV